MPRPLNDSPYLYGLHDPGGEHIMAQEGIFGWILFTEELGADPNQQSGADYSRWADQGFGIIARLNHSYEPNGTIPHSSRYASFAKRCANFVRASKGCHIWIIGNEMNFPVERPGVKYDRSQNPPRLVNPGEVITPGLYANCYRQCREAIKAVPGHEADQVIVGAVAPWNAQTTYEGNPNGDWVKYLEDILTILGPTNCDGIAIHAYTHGADPKLVYTDTMMAPPFQNRQYNFRVYQDFLQAVPRSMRHLPVYLTETDQNDEWRDENKGWVQRVYGEIDWWNRQPGTQVIRAVILYRWPKGLDKWGIEGKMGVIEDFRKAMAHKYSWEAALQAKAQPQPQPEPTIEPVQPATDTTPITFKETGYTARGPFVAFYRQYGVDITGYPISNEYVHPETGLKTQDWQRLIMEEYPAGKVRLRLVGQEVRELRQKVGRLEQQIARLMSGQGGPAEPPITDIIAQLPRKPEGFVKRPVQDIKYLVINHTAVRPSVGADRVAEAQLARWPGIVSQYFITGEGEIQQTNPIDEVVARDQEWIYNGINIYVAGNFNETIPTEAQLEALAQLCAWLLYKYNLTEDAIRGVSEFIVTQSPGLQWLSGQRWKEILLERVRAVPALPISGPQPQPTDGTIARLEAQVKDLQNQVLDLQAQLTEAEARNAALKAQLDALLKGVGGAPGRIPAPTITDIALQLPRDSGSLKSRDLNQIQYLVFNHTAVDPSVGVERVAVAHQRRWGAILYQYFITADGTILQTSPLDQVVDLSQPWIAQGINIALAGNFTSEVPTEAQIRAAAQLSAWLMQEYSIPADHVKGVCEFVNTQSPGKQWLEGKRWKDTLLAAIAEVQQSVPTVPSPGSSAEVAALRAQIAQLEAMLRRTQAEVQALAAERDRLRQQLSSGTGNTAELNQKIQALTQQVETLTAEKSTLAQQVQTLTGEKIALGKQIQTLTTEKGTLTQQVQNLSAEKTALAQQLQTLSADKAALTQQVQALSADKAALAQQVQTLSAEKTTLAQQVQSLSGEKATLAKQVQSLTSEKTALSNQLSTATQEVTALRQKVSGLEELVRKLQASGNGSGPQAIPSPIIVDLVDKLPKHETLKYDKRTLDKITHIAIHHSAASANVTPEQIAAYHVSKDWPGIGYHFYVAPDGTIYQTNRLETISYQVYKQNHYSLGICVAGTFNGVIPTPRQIEQTGHLVAWLMQKLNIPIENVWGHKEFPENATSCPGNDWLEGQKWKEMLLARIRAVQAGQIATPAKTIGHYMLFWQRQDDWAKEDWAAATNYIARFRPTAGFSVDDAKNAEYVTIVGGVAGVPYEVEQALIAAGCKVERLAGVDFADTKRMLDELAQSGRRFRTFNV